MTPYKAARIAAGIPSQRQAAIRLGMDLSQYRKYEEGQHKPGEEMIRRMVHAFGLTAGQILGLEPLPEVPVTAAC
ncbi:Helix-turn-helix domain protein [compost metagenome]